MTIRVKVLEDVRAIKEMVEKSVGVAYSTWESRGFKELPKPTNEFPELPATLSDMPNSELVNLLVYIRGWAGFLGEQMLMCKVIRDARIAEHKAIRAKVVHEIRDEDSLDNKKRMGTEERKTVCEANPDILEADCRSRVADYNYDMLKFRYELLSKMHGTVSRIIAVRLAEMGGRLIGSEGSQDYTED